jgi:hypothetical protein
MDNLKKLTIQKIARFDTNKEGDTLTTKDGRPYTRVILNTKEYPSDKISGFGSPVTDAWKEGDVVEVIIEEKGEYVNFKLPKAGDAAMQKILGELTAIKLELRALKEAVVPQKKGKFNAFDEPTFDDSEPTDVPF